MKREAKIEVANKLIAMLETEGTDWIKPWAGSAGRRHRNAKSKRPYRGINTFLTACAAMERGFESADWNTYKGWAAMGRQVAKGERGTAIVFWKRLSITDKATGDRKIIPFARMYTVFNGAQLTEPYGVEPVPEGNFVETIAAAEALIVESKAVVKHAGSSAFYSPSSDEITMPNIERFTGTDGYYSTLLHELTHWTGHKTRMDRNLRGGFGSPDYAFEELIAELGSAMLCAYTGVSAEPRADHARYINSWLKGLRDRPESVWQAFSHAQRAVDFLTGVSFEDDAGDAEATVAEAAQVAAVASVRAENARVTPTKRCATCGDHVTYPELAHSEPENCPKCSE